MSRKQERQLQQAVNKMNMGDMLKAAEQNDFRLLATIGFLNKLAMISAEDHPFIALSSVKDMDERELAGVMASHIVYHDEGEFKDEDGESAGFPIVAAVNGRDEEGKLSVEYADTAFGGSLTHYRLIMDGNQSFVTVFCEEINKTIIVTDGEWFTA